MSLHEFDFDLHIFAAAEPLEPGPNDEDWSCDHGDGPCGYCANRLLGDEPPAFACCGCVGTHSTTCG